MVAKGNFPYCLQKWLLISWMLPADPNYTQSIIANVLDYFELATGGI